MTGIGMNKMELNLENIATLMQLMVDNKIDQLKIADLVLIKTKHDTFSKSYSEGSISNNIDDIDDEDLYHSVEES